MSAKVSLQEILDEVQLSLEKLKQPCSKENLVTLAEYCHPWKIVGRHLKLDEKEIDVIDNNDKKTDLKRIRVMEKWKESFAYKATYEEFVKALLACGLAETAQNVCTFLKDQEKSPGSDIKQQSETKSRRPALAEVFKVLIPVAAKWKDIGAILELNEGALDTIGADQRSAMGAMREMLTVWLRQVNPNPTIKALAEAVKAVGNPFLAEKIEALE